MTFRAKVEDLNTLKGQYIRNKRDNSVYLIEDVGKMGVTTHQVNADGQTFGPETVITWRGFDALYNILVAVEDIDDGKLAQP